METEPATPQDNPIYYILILCGILFLTSLLLALAMVFLYGYYNSHLLILAITNGVSLTMGVLITFVLTRTLVSRVHPLFIFCINFLMILGITASGFLYSFLTQSFFFLYSSRLISVYFLINFSLASGLSLLSTVSILYQQKLVKQQQRIHSEKLLRTEMEKQLIRSKLNPHFLFNALNTITSLLETPLRAEEAIINLAELLRFHLYASETETVPLEKELNHVEQYLYLQKLRFTDKLFYNIQGTRTGQIPPLLIQPLVENCIKHNIDNVPELRIEIELEETATGLKITVADSCLALCPGMEKKGNGLRLTSRRVELAGGRFSIRAGKAEIHLVKI